MRAANVGKRHLDVTLQILNLRTLEDLNPAIEEKRKKALAKRDIIIKEANNRELRAIIRALKKYLPHFLKSIRKVRGHRSSLAYFKAKRKRLKSGMPWDET